MAYNYLTQYNSPNYTPGGDAVGVWGRPRTIEAIAIHWWDAPARNPSFDGVIATLCNPARQASAHFVATGTGRRVACLVDLPDASWATNSANPYTISIECDPRCRDEDYDVVAELVAEIRKEYGDLPLVPHKQFQSTACPGNWDLARLDREARAKAPYAGSDFGTTHAPVTPAPVPKAEVAYRVFLDGKQVGAFAVEQNAYSKWVETGRRGIIKDAGGTDITATIKNKYEPVIVQPPVPTPDTSSEKLDRVGKTVEENNSLLKQILGLLTGLIEKISRIFK